MKFRRATVVALVLMLAAVPASFAGNPNPNPKRPQGKYKLRSQTPPDNAVKGGSFRAAKDKRIKELKVTAKGSSTEGCGTSTIHMTSKPKLHLVDQGTYSIWAVGKKDADGSFDAVPVKYKVDGKSVDGTLRMTFQYDKPNRGDGYISVGSSCALFVTISTA